MRLRVEMLASSPARGKLQHDLTDLQALVEEGVAYARSAQANGETTRATDLLDNAIKFAGGAELVIEQIPPDTVDMVVRDKGPGIPASALRRATHGTTKTIAGHAYSTGPSASFRIEPWNHRP